MSNDVKNWIVHYFGMYSDIISTKTIENCTQDEASKVAETNTPAKAVGWTLIPVKSTIR